MLIDSQIFIKRVGKGAHCKTKRINVARNVVFNNSEIQKEKRVKLRTRIQLPSDRHLG